MKELEQESAFYEANKEEFRQKYLNKWLLITGNKLLGVYDNIAGAVNEAKSQELELGHFMIHRPADDDKELRISPFYSITDEEEPDSEMIISKGEPIAYPYA